MDSLQDINLKASYWSDKDDLINDFYIPSLSVSHIYKRISGFFSSTTLAIAAKGIASFIDNNGQMYLITSVVLSQEDKQAIEKALKEQESKVLEDIGNLEDALKRDHIAMLGWMIKNGKLKIKIAVVPNGIAHQKIGILEDKHNNVLSFSGSENETAFAWLYNDETFHVFKSWKDESQHLNDDINQFEKLWNGETKKTQIFSVSEAFQNGLIRIAPKSEIEFKKLSSAIMKKLAEQQAPKTKKKLRTYQEKAIDAWKANNFKGILEMATGTGKTLTSLSCIRTVEQAYKRIITIIVVPYQHLVTQWKKEFIDYFDMEYFLVEAHGDAGDWEKKLNEFLQEYSMGVIDKIAVFTVYPTFAKEKFHAIIQNYFNNSSNIMLIADEVHFLGAPEFSRGIHETYKFRLGLSATPQRWFDEEGSSKIKSYFGKTVFTFTLKEAIPEYLVPYDYYPQIVYMSPEELEAYSILAKKISRAYHFGKNDDSSESNKYLEKLLIERANIIVNNEEKKLKFQEIVLSLKEKDLLSHLLIYCSEKQIGWVINYLSDQHILSHKFTGDESPEDREKLLNYFNSGKYKILVAMKCLDQGVDVPAIKTAIVLASSTNPMQYIQRRGRVLRKYPGKEKATIYDFFVAPCKNTNLSEDIMLLEQKILKREIVRAHEFYETANNKDQVLSTLVGLMNKYHVYFEGGSNETGD